MGGLHHVKLRNFCLLNIQSLLLKELRLLWCDGLLFFFFISNYTYERDADCVCYYRYEALNFD